MFRLFILISFFSVKTWAQPKPELAELQVAREQYRKYDTISLRTAAILYEQILAKEPQNIEAMAMLSLLYAHFSYREAVQGLKNPYFNRSQELLNLAKQNAPDNNIVLRAQAHLLLVQNKKKEAQEIISRLLSQEIGDPELHYLSACISPGSLVDENTPAGSAIKKALELNPKFLWALEDKFLAHLQRKDYNMASNILRHIEESYPQYPEIKLYRFLYLLHTNNPQGLEENLQSYLNDRNALAAERIKNLLLVK